MISTITKTAVSTLETKLDVVRMNITYATSNGDLFLDCNGKTSVFNIHAFDPVISDLNIAIECLVETFDLTVESATQFAIGVWKWA
ncbi:hypothetical protein NCTGTJJY_CDS0102 [Serratia phage 92A1]|nr:hypothetical protein NCTGTJJY_CDS0102 [Serratia phage 92A1]